MSTAFKAAAKGGVDISAHDIENFADVLAVAPDLLDTAKINTCSFVSGHGQIASLNTRMGRKKLREVGYDPNFRAAFSQIFGMDEVLRLLGEVDKKRDLGRNPFQRGFDTLHPAH